MAGGSVTQNGVTWDTGAAKGPAVGADKLRPGRVTIGRLPTIAAMVEPLIVSIRGRSPQVDPEAWVAPNATLIGQVRLAARASVWYSATQRRGVRGVGGLAS
jgi:hypothetical protein